MCQTGENGASTTSKMTREDVPSTIPRSVDDRLRTAEFRQHVFDCIENGRKPPAGFAQGREALRLADAALESPRTGEAVKL
ncbi:MAG: hypothetical protein M3Y41_17305 [Pseudomonadota bacterium]|nr:hypothetical protein [Pseudomonadota bacterium]